jgi:CRP-like cAMP-binding protein
MNINLAPRDVATALPNWLLGALSAEVRQKLSPWLEMVPMRQRQRLHRQGGDITHVYFPQGAIASITKSMEDGRMIEMSTVGIEGFVGVTAFLGERVAVDEAVIQISGPDGFRMTVEHFVSALGTIPDFTDIIRRYSVASLVSTQQSVACNGLHDLTQRCCRWLLMTRDRRQSDRLPLTHEFLSVMLGVRRASVTLVLGQLQKSGLIEARRGEIVLVETKALENVSCECYEIVRQQYARLLPECRPAAAHSG